MHLMHYFMVCNLIFSSKGLLREFLDPESNIRSDDFCYQKSNSLIADRILTKLTNVYGRDCVSIRILPEQLAILKSTIEKHGIAMVQIDGRPLDYGVIAKIKQEHIQTSIFVTRVNWTTSSIQTS